MKLIGLTDQFVYLLGTGVVGMGIMDFMDEEEGENVDADGGGDDLFGDGMGGEMDDDFGEMDDSMGMDGGMGMDAEMDDWVDGGDDDEFGMGGGGGGVTQELENRIDELENEVAEISSTVSTVRSENEQISAKVDDTEENVRKLLEIYEMVTRGVNPFVDDVQQGGMGGDAFGAGGDGEGGFGLFDGDEDEEESDLDGDVADAEAESFFDDDFEDEDDEFDDFGEDAGDDLGFDDPDEGMGGESLESEGASDEGGGQAGGSTFAELKEEYESGDADWAEGDGEAAEPEPDADVDAEVDPEPTTEDDGGFEFEEPAETEPVEPATTANSSGLDGKPYLAALPSGYVADLVVMEWLEFLVTEFGPQDAVRTITYYGDIGWISESVEEELLAYVGGFADVDEVDPEETGPATLAIDDHIQSLTFLSQLTGDAVQRRIVEHCAQIRGGNDGIQR
ncbi:fla cluster protein flaCE [Halorussus salilacus]|uniref:FlaD/FlaE family flagellar protein n=1 Tax=Halorussus salilacus TaxID=2953750 RepID=UPI00209D7CC6|nr:FlaD/FlaE family flagellar protein [Halorussus salilacus]USZ68127.1 fla cluster protein flaCE [Halorussus salilacus]